MAQDPPPIPPPHPGAGARRRLPVVVVGAGPFGLATAAWLTANGMTTRVFGDPMATWRAHMPDGMFLKSVPAASSISAPESGHRFADFRAARGRPPVGDTYPIPVDEFIAYGHWFQERLVPDVERTAVREVRTADGGFGVSLDTGEEVTARAVVVATGLVAYAHRPAALAPLVTAGLASHSCDHQDFTAFDGRRVAVVGAGQSALESAALLHEAGARPVVIARTRALLFGDPPPADRPAARSRSTRLRKPGSALGPGWSLFAVSHGPAAYRRLPLPVRAHFLRTVLGPSGAWWLRDRVDGHFPVWCARSLVSARQEDGTDGAVRLEVEDPAGRRDVLHTDHVLAATGYRVDVGRIPVLEPALRTSVATSSGGAPVLSAGFESSVPGLYFTGLAAAPTFGPLLRFVHGTTFAAHRVAASVAGSVAGGTR
ncbi:NAD(P)-binding domain-containing protein [Streptomyces sp. NBC_01255]|uniref:NAD(P)-binding domain-containing protein n=1 Tax=Streptomyces sp. NBC_01255 TaxID=2903798 RepID=UPI002E34EFA1|nr:NAD(P)-binding domain-containing protein [Streptomyces sp. NBC_01255]